MLRRFLLGVTLVAVVTGCSGPEKVQAFDPERPWRQPGDKIDSIFPMPEMIQRFRQNLAEVTELTEGERSREALARRYLDAVSKGDSATVRNLLLTKAEFAWLFFPDHLYSAEPYELDPEIFWLRLTQETRKGSGRVLERYGQTPLRYLGLEGCQRDDVQIRSGPDTVWTGCRVKFTAGDSTLSRALFGSIVQRNGQHKFLSYHTEF